MAKFRCKLSGNVFEFVNDFDINDMLEHPQYDLIEKENDNGLQEEKQNTKEKVTKPRKTKEAK